MPGPLCQPVGCNIGLELSWSGTFLICGTGLWHVSVTPIIQIAKQSAPKERPFSRQEGERDPCLNFPAQMS